MNFDFPLLLTVLTLVTGVIWAIDALFFAGARKRAAQAQAGIEGQNPPRPSTVVEYSASFFPVLLIVLVFRSFIAEPFRIPTGSMIPTLLIGDFIVVNKFAYGLRLPVLNTKILDVGKPERGDVVVFRKPANPSDPKDKDVGVTYVKRLVGLPGDSVRYQNHQLYINDQPVSYKPISGYVGDASNREESGDQLLLEDLPGRSHQMLHLSGVAGPNTGPVQLGKDQYFMMGDNRDRSSDSRFWGIVSESDLVGKVTYIWFHWDWNRKGVVAWRRIGTRVE